MVKMNLYDRILSVWNPEKALRNGIQRGAMMAGSSDLQSGSTTKGTLRDWVARLRGANRVNEGFGNLSWGKPRSKTMSRARDLVRNDAFARGAVTNGTNAIVGAGLHPQSTIDYEILGWSEDRALKMQRKIEAEFKLYAATKDFDVARKYDFYEMQWLMHMAAWVDGDCFFMFPQKDQRRNRPYKGTMQAVLADRCDTPMERKAGIGPSSCVGGVELDADGAESAFYFFSESPEDFDKGRFKATKYDAYSEDGRRQVFHLMCADWPDQARGISYLAPVIDLFHTLDKYSDAELTAAVVSAYLTVFLTSEKGDTLPPLKWDEEGGSSSESGDKDDVKLGPGSVLNLAKGTTVSTVNPGRPNDKFDPFVQAILKKIAVGLNLPYEMLVMHFSSSYSASRAAIIQAWQFFRIRREWLAKNFCGPVWERFMDEAVATGRIKAAGYFEDPLIRSAWLGVKWIGAEPQSLDPLKDANAQAVRLETGVTDLDIESMRETGQSYMDRHSKIVKIAQARTKDGLLTPGVAPLPPPAPAAPPAGEGGTGAPAPKKSAARPEPPDPSGQDD